MEVKYILPGSCLKKMPAILLEPPAFKIPALHALWPQGSAPFINLLLEDRPPVFEGLQNPQSCMILRINL
jgi:hypothetical protein